jgi:hypothetical protein
LTVIDLTFEADGVNFYCGPGVILLSGADIKEQPWHPITIDWRFLRGKAAKAARLIVAPDDVSILVAPDDVSVTLLIAPDDVSIVVAPDDVEVTISGPR